MEEQEIYSLFSFLQKSLAQPVFRNETEDLNFNWFALNALAELKLFMNSSGYVTGINELTELAKHCSAARYGYGRIRIDPSVVRGLEYYTGPVFEVELTFPIEDEKGNPVRFGSVGGGGRYDGLVARFRGEPVPATGFSIGVSRLLAALRHLGKIEDKPAPGPVVVTVFDRDRLADYQRMVQQLRDAPLDPKKPDGPRIRAELYLGNPRNFGNQLKYADRRNSPCVVIQGGDEKNNPAGPHVLVKDLILGAELAKLEKGREEHLQRQAEAQRLVPEGELVEAVRAVLTRHNVTWERTRRFLPHAAAKPYDPRPRLALILHRETRECDRA